ncbi:hypothetical protein AJ80_00579 [Polytolypa hystricis UAMH7299]|uniref:pectate lyase n=1 Tax=Polytolypa hystricis (strain UAMH7299) TaxID=1447883 RepID=A0A2B7Z356_POLH7|nr:hypothetical protein AJ80_00579 [Polytolypa hystricis UAMH7299]
MTLKQALIGTIALAATALGAAPVDQLVGYGAGTTGGGSGSGTTVTSCSQLEAALKNGGVIRVNGMLNGCDILRPISNTSILGVGSNSGMVNGGLRLRQVSNVIIRNMKFDRAPPKGDALALDEATQVWIDHCEFKTVGLTGGKDDYDGLLDITHASDMVTVSWNKFYDHWKGSLVGHSDSNAGEDTGHLRITYHHNEFSNINSRTPSVRFGTAHVYSSCYTNIPTSGINSRMGAQVLVEHTHFSNVKRAIITNLDSKEDGYAVERNNVFDSSTIEITQQGNLSPPYSYTTDPASQACSIVRSSAGVGVVG